MRTRLLMRVGVVALAAALAGCGSDTSSGDDPQDAGAEPRSGGSMSVIQVTEPRTLDPALMGNGVSGNTLVGNSLYGQLVTTTAEGEVEPGLAESVSTSDGGTTWELTLRDGLTFSDGSPLDAAAVQFNWERIKDPATGSPARALASYIAAMEPSGQVLEFTLTQQIAGFDKAIADQLNWLAAPQALQAGAQAFDADPIGAGPFVLGSWTRGGEMTLTRNPEYFDSPRPYLDELVLTANPDAAQRWTTVQADGADATVSSADVRAQAVEQGMNATQLELGGGYTIVLNTRTAPFDDVRARRAVAQAVDLEAVNAAAYAGYGEVPDTLFVDEAQNGDAQLPAYDPAAAQDLFDEIAADGSPVEFTITAYQVTQNRRVAEAFQAQLNQYDNVQVEVEVLDYPAATAKTQQRTFQGIVSGMLFNDPALTLYANMFSSAPGNVSGIDDPDLDTALLAALTATDREAQNDAYAQVAELYSELAPSLIYMRGEFSLVYSDRVHGVELYGSGAMRTDTLWVS